MPDIRGSWQLTAHELEELITAGRSERAARAAEDEILAFNIGALVLSAFNAPDRFPRTPAAAFGKRKPAPADGGKQVFAQIAEQFNKRFIRQETVYDCRRT